MTEIMRALGSLAWIVLFALLILCCCPGGNMDSAFAADSKHDFVKITDNINGIKVAYYDSQKRICVDTCHALYFDDSSNRWRLDGVGVILYEKYSKYYPRIKECWLINN